MKFTFDQCRSRLNNKPVFNVSILKKRVNKGVVNWDTWRVVLGSVIVTFGINRLENINELTMRIRGVIAADPTTMEGQVWCYVWNWFTYGLFTKYYQPRRVLFSVNYFSNIFNF